MEKFVSYEKMSKKQQKIVNASKRGSWGNVKPITKVKASAKIYNRKKKQNSGDYGLNRPPKVRPKNLILGGRFFNGKIQF